MGGGFGRPIKNSSKFGIILHFTIWPTGPPRTGPTGGKSRNTGFLAHFGLGQSLALREIPGGKQKNAISQWNFWGRERGKRKPVPHGRPPLVRPAKVDQKIAKRPPPQWRARELPTRPDSPLLLTKLWPRVHHVSQPFGATLRPNREKHTPFNSVLICNLD